MTNTTNMVFSFLGGVAVGALAAFGILKKTGRLTSAKYECAMDFDGDCDISNQKEDTMPQSDKPSFISEKTMDTRKVQYDGVVRKPDLEELAKQYENADDEPAVIKEAAEREYPDDDDPTEEELEEQELQDEIGAALIERDYTDGFGAVLCPLNSKRRENVVYLVHEEDAGEIYPLEDLTYYAGDDVLCDVTDTPIDDVDRVLADGLEHFGECGEDPDKLYVRNCSIGFEYEVTRVDGYYGAKLYGVKDSELKEALKSVKKRKVAKDDE